MKATETKIITIANISSLIFSSGVEPPKANIAILTNPPSPITKGIVPEIIFAGLGAGSVVVVGGNVVVVVEVVVEEVVPVTLTPISVDRTGKNVRIKVRKRLNKIIASFLKETPLY
jgi:hypothetical protein